MNLNREVLTSVSALAIVVALSAGTARAQPPVYNWTGFYIGANAGYGWGTGHEREEFGTWSTKGGLFGVQGGYNMHWQGMVVGFEADAMLGTVHGDSDIFFSGKNANLRSNLDWAGSVRLRAGVPIDNFLIYGTGGLAFSQWEGRLRQETVTGFDTFKDRQFHVGWTLGVGGEYSLGGQFSAKIEYLYADYGKQTYQFGGDRPKIDHNLNMVRFGINYRFAPPPP